MTYPKEGTQRRRIWEALDAGNTTAEIMALMGCKAQTVSKERYTKNNQGAQRKWQRRYYLAHSPNRRRASEIRAEARARVKKIKPLLGKLSFQQIADKLGTTRGAVAGAVWRAKQQAGARMTPVDQVPIQLPVNRRRPFTPDRRAIEAPLVDGVERVGDRSCGA